jgi:hypothetical protein
MPKLKDKKQDTLYKDAKTYLSLKKQIEELTSELELIKTKLKKVASNRGYENEQGHITVVARNGNDEILITNLRKVRVYLKTDALDTIKKYLPDMQKYLIEKIEVVREDKLRTMVENGEIPLRIAKKLYGEDESYSLIVKEQSYATKKSIAKR